MVKEKYIKFQTTAFTSKLCDECSFVKEVKESH